MIDDWFMFVNAQFGRLFDFFRIQVQQALLFLLLVAVIAGLIGLFTGRWDIALIIIVGTAIFLALFLAVGFVVLSIRILIECAINVLRGADGDIGAGVPTVVGAAIAAGAVVDCQDARDLLATARAALAAAESARNRQAQRVQEAKRSVQTATDMLILALAGLVAAIFQPWVIPELLPPFLALPSYFDVVALA